MGDFCLVIHVIDFGQGIQQDLGLIRQEVISGYLG